VQISRGERVEIELRMGHSAVLLEPLIVRARAHEGVGGFRDRMRTNGFGRFMGREQIERRSAMRVTDLLRTVPGVQLVSTGVGSTYVLMRGGAGQCAPDIYLDGSRLRQSREVDVDAFVTPASLEGVEVYTSASATPSVFASSSACGVVAFWTRPAPPGRWSWRWFGAGLGAIGLLFLLAL
jgi:outer membrane receptor for Fe3+-dicitrate